MVCFDDNTAVEFLDGALASVEARQVEGHAAQCDDCRSLLAELARAPSVLDDQPTVPRAGDAHIDLRPGDRVGRFMILNRVGQGGMGVVFSAYDPQLDRKVALKLLRGYEELEPRAGEAQARLVREAQAIAQLSHPNVISVYDVGTYKDEVYIAMEFVEGATLLRWRTTWKPHWRQLLEVFLQAGRALDAAHIRGLIHRDFKPDNVLVGEDGRVRVTDFGLARSYLAEHPAVAGEDARALSTNELSRRLTRTGALMGTPRYMAPEQFALGEADARSDQFSYCVSLYEALYGQHPFAAGTAENQGSGHAREPEAARDVPRWLHRVVVRGLHGDPDKRYASMSELLGALSPPNIRWMNRRRALWATASVVVLFMVVSGFALKSRSDASAAEARLGRADSRLADIERDRDQLIGEREDLRRQVRRLHGSLVVARQQKQQAEILTEQTRQQLDETLARLEAIESRLGRRSVRRKRGVSLGEARGHLKQRNRELAICFDEWRSRLEWDDPLRNDFRLRVKLSIAPTGEVVAARVVATPNERVLNPCVRGALKAIRFPKATGTTVVQYEFSRGSSGGLDMRSRIVGVRSGD